MVPRSTSPDKSPALRLARAVHDDLVAHAREGAPEEVCGVLGGERGAVQVATIHRRAENAADHPRTAYAIDPTELLDLVEAIEADGHAVVGFYHSHPAGPPRPSETDADAAAWPDRSYVLVSLDGREPFVGSWRWRGDRFEREALAVR